MGLFKSLKNVVRGKSQDLSDAITNPIRDGKLAIADSEKLIASFTAKIARLLAQDKVLGDHSHNEKLIKKLRDQLSKARTMVANAKAQITSLEARHECAEIRTEMAKASSEFNSGDSPLALLNQLEELVTMKEAEAEAWEDLDNEM